MLNLLAQITSGYKVIDSGYVAQIISYHGQIRLTQLEFEKKELITIATHLRGKYLHIMLIVGSIKEIQEDYKNIEPVAVFTVKHNTPEKLALHPSRLDRILFGKLSKRMFEVFIKVQKVLFDPIN